MSLTNDTLANHRFLQEMFDDGYFPDPQVKKGVQILVELCERIEAESPSSLDDLYPLTHEATEQFNELQEDFEEAGSEIETAARDCICENFAFIARAYGFDADIEELVATRDW